jgi:hypothetical protein
MGLLASRPSHEPDGLPTDAGASPRTDGSLEVLFEGQMHATGLPDNAVATLESWLLHARGVEGAGTLFDTIRSRIRSGRPGPIELTSAEARTLVAVFEASGYEHLRTLLARARASGLQVT